MSSPEMLGGYEPELTEEEARKKANESDKARIAFLESEKASGKVLTPEQIKEMEYIKEQMAKRVAREAEEEAPGEEIQKRGLTPEERVELFEKQEIQRKRFIHDLRKELEGDQD